MKLGAVPVNIPDIRGESTTQDRHLSTDDTHGIRGWFDLRRLGSELHAARIVSSLIAVL